MALPTFATAPNFRDLGGAVTADGRRVACGRVFRSGHLAMLDDTDLAAIDALGIRTVIDLRAADERTRRPARWTTPPARVHGSPHESLGGAMRGVLSEGTTVAEARAGFTAFYRRLPDLYRDEYRLLFAELADGVLPLLIGCTAGKDRTGLACALLLTVLGVPYDAVFADYAETNARLPALKRQRGEAPVGGAAGDQLRHRAVPPEVLDVMWAADPGYLAAALDEIGRAHGSVEAYVTGALDVGPAAFERLRGRLTEPV